MLYVVTVLFLVLNFLSRLRDQNYLYFVFCFDYLRSQAWMKTQIVQA